MYTEKVFAPCILSFSLLTSLSDLPFLVCLKPIVPVNQASSKEIIFSVSNGNILNFAGMHRNQKIQINQLIMGN